MKEKIISLIAGTINKSVDVRCTVVFSHVRVLCVKVRETKVSHILELFQPRYSDTASHWRFIGT